MKTLLALVLRRLGFSGKSLDKAIAMMTKLDTYLEQVEQAEKEKADAAARAIDKATLAKADAETNAARAARIRSRAQDFVS